MSRPFPYAYISCPCANTPVPDPSKKRRSRESPQKASSHHPDQPKPPPRFDDSEDEQTFDPRAPRSNFSLYPPEHLLYCEDCHQIKCPRCITEEIVCWYCPNCLFETPSSMVKSEGNRCARNCFNCPACTAPLAVNTLENVVRGGTSQQGPWVLSCGYCMWSTLDIGIKFDKPTNIRTQLAKLTATDTNPSRSRQMSRTFADLKSPLSTFSSIDEQFPPAPGEARPDDSPDQSNGPLSPDARFHALKSFYKTQISATSSSPSDPLGVDFGAGFSSPGALNRIISLYTSSSRLSSLYGGASKKPKTKPPVMREALTASEGFKTPAADAEAVLIQRMAADECGWDGLASLEQRVFQSPDARFVEELLPLATLLRTKRAKRCKSCKHILVKPEQKPQSTRFRIRLIALSYIPLPTLRPLVPPPAAGVTSGSAPGMNLDALPPLRPTQLLLTLKNHMFDPVRITLATPSVTPGRVASKVTILCPQFDIGANSDVWDEALQGNTTAAGAAAAGGGTGSNATADQRSSRSGAAPATATTAAPGGHLGMFEKVAEAGKVWDKGRNWTTVVLEVVPGTLPSGSSGVTLQSRNQAPRTTHSKTTGNDSNSDSDTSSFGGQVPDWTGQAAEMQQQQQQQQQQQLQPDEDVLEIPVFVRMEWDSENQIDRPGVSAAGEMVKRELAYWMVLGVGRIDPSVLS
ncbi:putative dynactin Arp1 p62 subunit RO2 [Aspergillus fijiensis CBS 313.89]|uniref:Dynactin subunit 4 n=1 Tax=Aspergillus fijiensis CBS 313.89 TaxID=1448319 RepID=A0A8G1RN13_9EURO|nr:dynactin Arp1 p62 subunit RO2 [Aspergillus fijiensis CBS 313.89]RAK76265.1 dynactin Arp1 p62 subunit RO2 [Aspergillus fijiensis CBS 313.89]